jgi:hypothetical protein
MKKLLFTSATAILTILFITVSAFAHDGDKAQDKSKSEIKMNENSQEVKVGDTLDTIRKPKTIYTIQLDYSPLYYNIPKSDSLKSDTTKGC